MMRLVELNSRSLDFLPDQKNSKSLKRALSPSSAIIFCYRHVAKDTGQLSNSGMDHGSLRKSKTEGMYPVT